MWPESSVGSSECLPSVVGQKGKEQLLSLQNCGGWTCFRGWPSFEVTHFGSFEMSFHLRRLEGRGPSLLEDVCLVDGAAVLAMAS